MPATAEAGITWSIRVRPAAEIAAARSRLEAAAPGLPADQQPLLAALLAELDRADGCADLPQALIHPDFVPANAILTPDGGLVLVDWTGACRGPRLYPLAFLLWAAGLPRAVPAGRGRGRLPRAHHARGRRDRRGWLARSGPAR